MNVLEGGKFVVKEIYGGPGDDVLGDLSRRANAELYMNGEAGDDVLVGSPYADRLRGAGGRDNLKGNKGDDRANGGGGKDRCRAERKRSCER